MSALPEFVLAIKSGSEPTNREMMFRILYRK